MDFAIALIELLGSWMLGNKRKTGFVILAVSNIGWILYVLHTGKTYGLLMVVIPAFFVNGRNFMKWRRSGASAEGLRQW